MSWLTCDYLDQIKSRDQSNCESNQIEKSKCSVFVIICFLPIKWRGQWQVKVIMQCFCFTHFYPFWFTLLITIDVAK